MSESLCIDSPFLGLAMPKSYSGDLRERVIEAVETGASRREAAERFEEALAADLGRWPFQRARLLLAHGQWLRRQRRITESRAPPPQQ